jgi:DNA replication and repair protein RecF
MRITSLTLEHFRNYTSQTVRLSDADIQLFVGENGSGKTNVIEAISLLSLTKSCRGKEEQDIVEWNSGHYRVSGTVRSDTGLESIMEIVSEIAPRRRKALFINDVRSPVIGYVGMLPTVTFLPQDLLLFSGTPSERRRFLDQLLSQVSSAYFNDLSSCQKIVQQRNALLKRIASGTDSPLSLSVWDAELAAKASSITLARLELIETLNLTLLGEIRSLGEAWESADIRYERKTASHSQEELKEELITILRATRERDIILQSTGTGPHREDWQVYRDGRAIPTFASRGQERVAVLALLLLEVSYLELRRNEKPVILLDDAFSELDDAHQAALLDAFKGYQVLMTSTRVPPNAEGAKVFEVKEGVVREVPRDKKQETDKIQNF